MEPKRITSLSNPAVKAAAKLKQPRASKEAGCFIVEGARSVEELTGDWETESLWVSDTFWGQNHALGWEIAQRLRPSAFCHTPDSILNAIAGTQSPQGILAVVRRRYFTVQDVLEHQSTTPLLVILEDLQDPGNAGTILRTADAAGANGIICTEKTVDFYNAKVVRASMGSVFHLPFHVAENLSETLIWLRNQGIQILAAHLDGDAPYFQQDLTGPCAILIGNEGAGLSKGAASLSDMLVKIPQPGRAESLNAAVAAAILVYDVIRQRMSGSKK